MATTITLTRSILATAERYTPRGGVGSFLRLPDGAGYVRALAHNRPGLCVRVYTRAEARAAALADAAMWAGLPSLGGR